MYFLHKIFKTATKITKLRWTSVAAVVKRSKLWKYSGSKKQDDTLIKMLSMGFLGENWSFKFWISYKRCNKKQGRGEPLLKNISRASFPRFLPRVFLKMFDVFNGYTENFFQEISHIEARYKRKFSPTLLVDYCWSFVRDTKFVSCKRFFMVIRIWSLI